jgi:glutathionyl-hydroquinone reductase
VARGAARHPPLPRRRPDHGLGLAPLPTLVRFDAVYVDHFRCNLRRLVDHPNLWGYTRELYQRPGIAETVAMDQIKRHYYTTHDSLEPSRIIPIGPAIDFSAPHGRG